MFKEEDEFCPITHNFYQEKLHLQEIGFLYKISLVNIDGLQSTHLYPLSHCVLMEFLWG